SPINLELGIRLSGTGYLSGIWGNATHAPNIWLRAYRGNGKSSNAPHTSQAALHRLIPVLDGHGEENRTVEARYPGFLQHPPAQILHSLSILASLGPSLVDYTSSG
ncbi:hypothetical protein ACJ72_05660, partial [Emergomyces africanus]